MSLPIPNLDDRQFDGLVEEARKRIPMHAPQWTDHNLHDPGMTLIELFSWLTEMQLYSLDQVTGAHLLKYLSLLGMQPTPASPAAVELRLSAEDVVPVPGGTAVYTAALPGADKPIRFETEEDIEVIPAAIQKVVTYSGYHYVYADVTDFNDQPGSYYHALGRSPARGSALFLGIQSPKNPTDLAGKTLNIAIVPAAGGPTNDPAGETFSPIPSARVEWQYWDGSGWFPLTVTSGQEIVLALSLEGFFSIRLPGDIARGTPPPPLDTQFDPSQFDGFDDLMWIRCYVLEADYEIPPRIDRILFNTVAAVEGRAAEEQFTSSGLPGRDFQLLYYPVVPGSCSLTRGTVPGEEEEWTAVVDFDASGPGDRHYVPDPAAGLVRFGDGIRGSVPPKDAVFTVRYRGMPDRTDRQGGIDADTIETIDIGGITAVNNPYPSRGGSSAETIDDAFNRFKQETQLPGAAITAGDYEALALATPGLLIARAKAVVTPGSCYRVDLVVVPYSLKEPPLSSSGFKKTVCRCLDSRRPITTLIHVSDPDYVEVSITVELDVAGGYDPEQVSLRVRDAYDTFLAPLDLDNGGGWAFGRPVYRSEVYEVTQKVEGVNCVLDLSLSANGGTYTPRDGNIEIGHISLVYPGTHRIDINQPFTQCEGG